MAQGIITVRGNRASPADSVIPGGRCALSPGPPPLAALVRAQPVPYTPSFADIKLRAASSMPICSPTGSPVVARTHQRHFTSKDVVPQEGRRKPALLTADMAVDVKCETRRSYPDPLRHYLVPQQAGVEPRYLLLVVV